MSENKFAIVVSRFNEEITSGLLQGAQTTLIEKGFAKEFQDVFFIPGAFEAPLVAKKLALTKKYLGVICLGSVIKGDTAHFEFISLGATLGIMNAMLEVGIPITFGIITTYTEEQAVSRSRNDGHNKGREAALACIEVLEVLKKIN